MRKRRTQIKVYIPKKVPKAGVKVIRMFMDQ